MFPKISVIILNWNGLKDTIECLESVRKIDYPNYDVIVVDNGSTDGSPETLRREFTEIALIENKGNLGYAEGNNVGIRYALKNGAAYIFILNNDTIVDSAILKEFIKAAAEHKDAGIFGAKIYYYSEPAKIWFAGGEWDKRQMSFSHIGFNEFDNNGKYNETRVIDYACGCALFFKKEVAEKIGMFDPRFYLILEEADWCYRARRFGYRVFLAPEAKVLHKISVSFGGNRAPLYIYYFTRNRLLWAKKNLSFSGSIAMRCQIIKEFFPHIFFMNGKSNFFQRVYWDLVKNMGDFKSGSLQAKFFGLHDFFLSRYGNCPSIFLKTLKKMSKINFICFGMEHHADHSGYDRIIDYFPTRAIDDSCPHWLSSLIPRAFVYLAAKHSGVSWYSKKSMVSELKTIIKSLGLQKQIFHFLYGEDAYFYSGFFPRNKNQKLVCSFHQPPEYFKKHVKKTNHLYNLDGLVVVSLGQRDFFSDIIGTEKVFFVPHGIDVDYFAPGQSNENGHTPTCLFVGKWLRDFEMLKQVIQLVNAKNKNVRFQIVSEPAYYKDMVGLQNTFFYSALTEQDLLMLYQKATLLLLPLLDCTANNAILEGMACGLPIVTTDVGGVRDYVNEHCAILVKSGDSDAMSRWVLELIENSTLRKRMSKEARKKALEYSWPSVVNQLKSVYVGLFNK